MKLAVGFILFEEATARYLPEFLPSLETALGFLSAADYRVYAFDNSAPDNTVNRESIGKEEKIHYETLGKNLGFSRAYNIMIRRAQAEGAKYFLVINPDTLLDAEAIRKLVEVLDEDGSLGSVAPKILRLNHAPGMETRIIDSLGLELKPGLRFVDIGQGKPDQVMSGTSRILGPSGAAGLFRMDALEKISVTGGDGHQPPQYFDERFFMYKEDCDLAYRLFLAGFKSLLIPEALVYHDRTAAENGRAVIGRIGSRQSKSRAVRAWSFCNQHLIYLKHWPKQNFVNRVRIAVRILLMFTFALILEQFLLKEYPRIIRRFHGLTDIK